MPECLPSWLSPIPGSNSQASPDDSSFQIFKFPLSTQAPADSLKPLWTHWFLEPNLAPPSLSTPPTKFLLWQTTIKGHNTVQVTSLLGIPQPQRNKLPQLTTLIIQRLIQAPGFQPFILHPGLNSFTYQ
ncbi:hypothetical protein CHARACLAT_018180 [Characodon lateralis]|uniref:Uncharacterized protein n=1 Tax=Characodon lateralis TaxID=208331 RepID=A0ABU7D1P5_9TELE|nr:hypothetical protein [Characodon lateralis]